MNKQSIKQTIILSTLVVASTDNDCAPWSLHCHVPSSLSLNQFSSPTLLLLGAPSCCLLFSFQWVVLILSSYVFSTLLAVIFSSVILSLSSSFWWLLLMWPLAFEAQLTDWQKKKKHSKCVKPGLKKGAIILFSSPLMICLHEWQDSLVSLLNTHMFCNVLQMCSENTTICSIR